MRVYCFIGCFMIGIAHWASSPAGDVPSLPRPKLRIAFSSYRDRVKHPQVYFYELNGSDGKLIGGVPPIDKRSDHHPSLTKDLKTCIYCLEHEGQASTIQGWNLSAATNEVFPQLHDGDTAHMSPSISGDGQLIAFDTWRRRGGAGRWDVMLYDVAAKSIVNLPGLNTDYFDERKPGLSGDGNCLAFSTNAKDGQGLTDVRLYRRKTSELLPLSALNSSASEGEPAVSQDGRFIVFISDRDGGAGARDVYLFDVAENRLVPLPGLNSPGQEQSPSISADARFIAFVSERLDAVGERDIFLYDRQTSSLCPTPNLNSVRDESDPYVVVVAE